MNELSNNINNTCNNLLYLSNNIAHRILVRKLSYINILTIPYTF